MPLILFQTSSEFQQQNVIPGAAQEGVGAFAEPIRKRIVMPMDEPPDLLYRLMVHELTHQFEFDMIPMSLVRRTVPLWVAFLNLAPDECTPTSSPRPSSPFWTA